MLGNEAPPTGSKRAPVIFMLAITGLCRGHGLECVHHQLHGRQGLSADRWGSPR